ncbi:MAG: putative selenate ABC transporter substrate-binding protein [Dehalococcoidia bacterium]|nr:putative selenate ABC transporter substrate-binding protein [Dehalococcoidia bacterium]
MAAFLAALLAAMLILAACSSDDEAAPAKTLYIGGIPDVDVSLLQTRFNGMAQYLTTATGIPTKYVPSNDYAAVVTAFKQGDIPLAFFGGLTGVQARLSVPGASAIAQRSIDEHFTSVFVAQKGLGLKTLADLKGKTFTFGSESSTSGYTMPLYFLSEAKITPKTDFSATSFSGSHDKTWKLVEAGAFQAGALNASVWNTRVRNNEIDLTKVEVFYTTPEYYDYHWVARPDLDKSFGKGATQKITTTLLALNAATNDQHKALMTAFQDTKFVPTNNANYAKLETVARGLGIIQ